MNIETSIGSITPNGGRTVAVFSRDLFFGMRIRTVLRQLGYNVVISKEVSDYLLQLQREDSRPVLGIVDFNVPVDWSEMSAAIATGVPILAFGAHTDVEGFRAAKGAGVARVVSNGEFTRSLPELTSKYARLHNPDAGT